MNVQGAILRVVRPSSGEPTEAVEGVTEFPCTMSQRRFWSLDRRHPGDPSLNIGGRIRLEGRVSADLLERALQALVARHEPLRTAFVERDGVPVQRVLPAAKLRLRMADLSEVPEAERVEAAAQLAREEARRPFDLARPPLLRVTLVRFDAMTAELLLTTHYMVGDCWSNGVLARDMAEIYDALKDGRDPVLPELPMQFGDYARWQQAWLTEGGAASAEAYWQQRLANPPAFHVPTDRPPPAESTRAGNIIGMPVPRALAEAALNLSRARGATFFILGVAALAALLQRWTGKDKILFGTQVIGREDVDLEGLVGPFVNTVVLRLDLGGDPRFDQLLETARVTVGEALTHAAAPIERVSDALGLSDGQDRRRNPMTAVNFLIQRDFTFDSEHGDFTLKGMPSFSPGSKFDLNLFLVERPSGWRASCEYDPELFEQTTIERLIRCLLRVLEAVAADPACRVSAIAIPELTELPRPSVPPSPEAVPPDVAPDPDEARLAAIWTAVLGRRNIQASDNFFELGGDSMRAARLLARTQAAFGRTISLAQLFQAPTLGAMAVRLRGGAATPPGGVVPVQPEGTRPPIFAINNTGIFYTLSRHLGLDQPFIAVQALSPDVSPHLHPRDFREIAGRYVATIRATRPRGPYVLVGLCAAGKVAFEVAQQLMEAGEEVRLLAVVDTWAPGHLRRLSFGRRMLTHACVRAVRLRRQLQRTREGTLSVRGFIANRGVLRGMRNAAFQVLRRAGLRSEIPAGVQNNLFVSYLDNAAQAYQPRPYAGRVLVFHGPEQSRGRFLDSSFGWRGLVAGRVDVVAVPADQHTKFEDHHAGLFQDPGAQVMAKHIAAALR